ncbi:Protein phosphatase 2C [Penicillium cosmopolitanum]|uniref:Protein phosphatase 2C n=1 Tax=Penicillium cosmopolitanum TaxID=1131564 RepID=A0A9W9VSF8_9EURO|nr:Protein phosphatase 2C [Penicillium cosmopolitanum]KAJ5388472.1 Protein phosphatase 2C [Penicillium cosmopolitanum]
MLHPIPPTPTQFLTINGPFMIVTSARRVTGRVGTLASSYRFTRLQRCRTISSDAASPDDRPSLKKRPQFRDYFVTYLPSSSLHPDPRGPTSPFHKLPRSASIPHTGETPHSPTSFQQLHHYGAVTARGTRPANEDTYQAGVIDVPAFAKRPPASLTIKRSKSPPRESRGAQTATGDPQVFYFGIFDGHGGSECSTFLKENLHEYIQDTAAEFEVSSILRNKQLQIGGVDSLPVLQAGNRKRIGDLEKSLVQNWRRLVGGYFKRFKPATFSYYGSDSDVDAETAPDGKVSIEEILEYAFLRADLDFVKAQAAKRDDDLVLAEKPLNEDEILHSPSLTRSPKIGGRSRFKGGSTGTTAMISTPSPTPFWHPAAPSSLLVSHVGDTRALLCSTDTGEAIPVSSNHHPSSPIEAARLRRYATTFVTDSFGEERMSGLANTRAFGDVQSKRIGVSAEPELNRIEMGPAEFSFLVMMSDGISGTLLDQEIVDIIKEAKTPEQGARDVVGFATEVSREGDNATCLVVRLGGWERRQEGGVGSLGTKESREWRRQDATDPRRSRT